MVAPAKLIVKNDDNIATFKGLFYGYLVVVILIALYARMFNAKIKQKKESSEYATHFTGGKGYGSIVLFLTLFSTVFSAVTVDGVPNFAYGLGFIGVIWLTAQPPLFGGALCLIPRLRRLSAVRDYDSPNDFITDRYDHRLIAILCALMMSIANVCYFCSQIRATMAQLQTLTNYEIHVSGTIMVSVTIFIADSLGGFNAVSITDNFQSIVMLISLFFTPIIFTGMYDNIGNSCAPGCPNGVVVDCVANPIEGIPCPANGIWMNGCLADIVPHFVLNPAKGWSMWNSPAREGFKKPDPEWYAGAGLDGASGWYNNVPTAMFQFNALFGGFFLNPHWVQRFIASKTDHGLKKSMIACNNIVLVTTLPGLMLGYMVRANLHKVGGGGSAFVMMLGDMQNQGGFTQFMASIAAVALLAAIMSTADSCLLSITNMLTKTFLMEWLMMKNPSLNTPTTLMISTKITTLCVITLSTALFMLYPEFHLCSEHRQTMCSTDALEVSLTITNLTQLQNFLLWQLFPMWYFGLYWRKANPTAYLIAMVVGYAIFIGMFSFQKSCKSFGTDFARNIFDDVDGIMTPCEPSGFILNPYGPHLWSAWSGLVVALAMCTVLGEHVPGKGGALSIGIPAFLETPLSYDEILKCLVGTEEPVKKPVSIAFMLSAFLLCQLCLPMYDDSYNSCNIATYAAFRAGEPSGDCQGGKYIGGIPGWAFWVPLCWVAASICNTVAWCSWKTVDTEVTTDSFKISVDRQASGESDQAKKAAPAGEQE